MPVLIWLLIFAIAGFVNAIFAYRDRPAEHELHEALAPSRRFDESVLVVPEREKLPSLEPDVLGYAGRETSSAPSPRGRAKKSPARKKPAAKKRTAKKAPR